MRKLSLLLMITGMFACKKSTSIAIAENVPACIKQKIELTAKEEYGSSRVIEYEFKGETVYFFEASHKIADAPSPILKSDCTQICAVGGYGLPDVLDCQGVKFLDVAVKKREVWKR